jgi:hypothetical protein
MALRPRAVVHLRHSEHAAGLAVRVCAAGLSDCANGKVTRSRSRASTELSATRWRRYARDEAQPIGTDRAVLSHGVAGLCLQLAGGRLRSAVYLDNLQPLARRSSHKVSEVL